MLFLNELLNLLLVLIKIIMAILVLPWPNNTKTITTFCEYVMKLILLLN